MKAVLIEQDYKGYYGRYALTPEEFAKEFKERLDEDMPEPCEEADTYTLRPMVHIWYMLTEVHSEYWETFFTDMEWGLPESDIENDNLATVDDYRCESLKPLVEKYVEE